MYALILAAAVLGQPSPEQVHRVVDMLPKADADRDGFVTRAEWRDFRASQFGRFDRNRDGVLSAADAPPLMGRGALQEALGAFDTERDGRVSRAEFVDGPAPAFDRLDLNHDGVIDPREWKLARQGQ